MVFIQKKHPRLLQRCGKQRRPRDYPGALSWNHNLKERDREMDIQGAIDPAEKKRMYEIMVLIRKFEEKLVDISQIQGRAPV